MTGTEDLLALCRLLGEPTRDLVVVSEGNASVRLDDSTMLIKASGCAMATMTERDIVGVDRARLLPLLDSSATDEEVAQAYRSSVGPSAAMPSVEAILHAVIYEQTETKVIAHTHPVSVNAILCSRTPELLVGGALFPDHVVVLGRHQLLLPYVDPGVPLARAVRAGLQDFVSQHGQAPRVIYLVNHGLFVLAASTGEAERITAMADKVARILLGTLAAGGPSFLSAKDVDRIEGRPDEQYRRTLLEGT